MLQLFLVLVHLLAHLREGCGQDLGLVTLLKELVEEEGRAGRSDLEPRNFLEYNRVDQIWIRELHRID